MRRITLVLPICGLAISLVALSAASADPPAGGTPVLNTPPSLGLAHAADGQNVEINYAADNQVTERVARTAPPAPGLPTGGKVGREERYSVVEMRVRVVPIAQLVAERADGSAVSSDDLAKALASPTAVVLGYGGAKIDAQYLGMFKPDTLVLFLPKPATTAAPAPRAPITTQPAPAPSPRAATTTPTAPAAPAVPPAPAIPRKFGS